MNIPPYDPELNVKIAEALIDRMSSQIEILLSISAAICGGIVALYVQLAFKKVESNVKLNGANYLILSFIFEGLSIIFAYIANGAITALTPSIYRYSNPMIENWTSFSFDGSLSINISSFIQFMFFIIGMFLLLFVVVKNKHYMQGEYVMSKKKSQENINTFYKDLVKKRIDVNLRGYECTDEFKKGFENFYKKTTKVNQPITPKEENLFNILSDMAYKFHKNEFDKFYEEHIKNSEEFKGASKDEILNEVKKIAMGSFIDDPERWNQAWRFTYIWPICEPYPNDFFKMPNTPNH